MHDIAHHIENLLAELPSHVQNETCKKKIIEAVTLTTEKKTKSCWLSLLSANNLSVCARNDKSKSAKSGWYSCWHEGHSVQGIRSPSLILHYHNSSWYHHTLCKNIIGFTLKKKTAEVLWYIHAWLNSSCPTSTSTDIRTLLKWRRGENIQHCQVNHKRNVLTSPCKEKLWYQHTWSVMRMKMARWAESIPTLWLVHCFKNFLHTQ